ncbi:hypothetical protein MTO96_004887 [Rhipicephalus appendiculatus]
MCLDDDFVDREEMFFYYTPSNQPGQPAQPPHVPVQMVPVSATTRFSVETQQQPPRNSMDQGDLASAPDTTTHSGRPFVTRGIASTNMTRSRAMTEEQEAGEGGAFPQEMPHLHRRTATTSFTRGRFRAAPDGEPRVHQLVFPYPIWTPEQARLMAGDATDAALPSASSAAGAHYRHPAGACSTASPLHHLRLHHHRRPLRPPPAAPAAPGLGLLPLMEGFYDRGGEPIRKRRKVEPSSSSSSETSSELSEEEPLPPLPELPKYVPPEEASEAPSEPVAEKSTVLEEWKPPTPEKEPEKEPEIPAGPLPEEQPDMFPFFEEPQYGLLAWICLFLVALIPCLLLFFIVVPAGVYLGLFLYSSTISYCYSDSCKTDAATYFAAYHNGDPCEDFYELICGDWEYNHKIPPYRYIFSVAMQRQDRIEASLKRRLEDISRTVGNPTNDVEKLASMFHVCTTDNGDTATVVANAMKLLKSEYGLFPIARVMVRQRFPGQKSAILMLSLPDTTMLPRFYQDPESTDDEFFMSNEEIPDKIAQILTDFGLDPSHGASIYDIDTTIASGYKTARGSSLDKPNLAARGVQVLKWISARAWKWDVFLEPFNGEEVSADMLVRYEYLPYFSQFAGTIDDVLAANPNATAHFLALRLLLWLAPAVTSVDGDPESLTAFSIMYEVGLRYPARAKDRQPRYHACLRMFDRFMTHVLTVAFEKVVDDGKHTAYQMQDIFRALIRQNLTIAADKKFSFSSHTNARSRLLSYRKTKKLRTFVFQPEKKMIDVLPFIYEGAFNYKGTTLLDNLLAYARAGNAHYWKFTSGFNASAVQLYM